MITSLHQHVDPCLNQQYFNGHSMVFVAAFLSSIQWRRFAQTCLVRPVDSWEIPSGKLKHSELETYHVYPCLIGSW